jgi:hypothetical protein
MAITVSKTNQANGATFTINVPEGFKVASSYIVFKGRDKGGSEKDSRTPAASTDWDGPDGTGYSYNVVTSNAINIATSSKVPSNATVNSTHAYKIEQTVTNVTGTVSKKITGTGTLSTGSHYGEGMVARPTPPDYVWIQGAAVDGIEDGFGLVQENVDGNNSVAMTHSLYFEITISFNLHSAGLTAKLGGTTVATQTAQLANGVSSSQKSFSGMVAGNNVFTINTLNSSVVDVDVVYELERDGNNLFFGMNF